MCPLPSRVEKVSCFNKCGRTFETESIRFPVPIPWWGLCPLTVFQNYSFQDGQWPPTNQVVTFSQSFSATFPLQPFGNIWYQYLLPLLFFLKHSVSTSLYLSFSHVHAHTHAPTHTIHHPSSDHSFSRSIPLSNIFMYLFPKICLKSFISLYTLSALWLVVLMQYHGFSDPIYMDIKLISPVWHFHF